MTRYKINATMSVPGGLIAVSGSILAGQRLGIGQEGGMATSDYKIKVLVVGTGVSESNFGAPGRQGILLKLLEGDIGKLEGFVLEFDEFGASES